MTPLLRMLFAVSCAAILATPATSQNAGGLPGTEHTGALSALRQAERVVLQGDVVHYTFDLVVGPGMFDKIRIHRVVKETAPYRPVKKMEGVLLLPGLGNLFETIFMMSAAPGVPAEKGSVALFLASNDIDVWGMDYGWSFVPNATTDFAPLKGWGIVKDSEHAKIALSIARWMRATSGQGNGPINLLGFSYGAMLLYAVGGEDSQRPGNLRNVKGIIPVDGANFKVVPGSKAQQNACNRLPAIQASIDSGMYRSADNAVFGQLGLAALNAPDAPSATVPPFNNYQAIPVLLVRTGFLAGSVVISPPSVSLVYTEASRLPDLAATTPPFYPYQITYDLSAVVCDNEIYPVTFDNHLGEITVPIFYMARSEGPFYATTLTGSSEVTKLILNPAPRPYGHADIFLANNAADIVWQPIVDWILAHQ